MKLINITGIIGMVGTILLFGCSTGVSQYSPEQVINNALKGTADVGAYYGEAEMKISENGQKTESILIKEWVSEDGKRRIEALDNSEKAITVNDGNNLITYETEANQAYVIEGNPEFLSMNQMSPRQQAEQLLKMVQDTHEISAEGEEEIAGREAYHIIATAKENNALIGDQELWIDKENWMVLKMHSTSGDMMSEVIYTKVELDPEIPAGTFTLELPDDVQVQDLEEMSSANKVSLSEAADSIGKAFLHFPETDEFTISNVEQLELGGELQRAEVNIDYQKEGLPYFTMTVFQSTEDTGEETELFADEETVTVRGNEGTYTEMDEFRSFVWQENGLTYSILLTDPSLTLEDFTSQAENMVPVN